MEEWRDVPGFEGKYQVSIKTKEGRCRSVSYNKTGNAKEMSQTPHNYGRGGLRLFWHFRKDGVSYCKQAAYWIAITYPELIENEYFDGAEIDHKNTEPLDNRPCNLRWVTHKQNLNNDITKNKLSRSKSGSKNPNYKRLFSEDYRKKLSEAQIKRHKREREGLSSSPSQTPVV